MTKLFVMAHKLDAVLFSSVKEFDAGLDIGIEKAAALVHSDQFDFVHWMTDDIGIRHLCMHTDGRPIMKQVVRPDVRPESVDVGDMALVFVPTRLGIDMDSPHLKASDFRANLFAINSLMEDTSDATN